MDLINGLKDPVNKILWDEEKADRASGGFTLVNAALSVLNFLLKGAPLNVNYTTRVASVVKTATIQAGSTTTKTRISKGSAFKVGDVISQTVGEAAVAITVIDTSNDDYDELTHATNGGAFTEGNILFEATEVGGTSTYKYEANALLSDNTSITSTGSATVTAVIGALEVQEANLPFPISDAIKTSLTNRFQFV